MRKSKGNRPAVKTDRNIGEVITGVFGSIGRTTVRALRNLPNRALNFVKRKINDQRRKPKRKEMNKVYVLVGYTTKRSIDARYNTERNLMILRRGLLLIIFVLLLFICINAAVPYIDMEQYGKMFGIGDVEEMTSQDPFENVTVATVGEQNP